MGWALCAECSIRNSANQSQSSTLTCSVEKTLTIPQLIGIAGPSCAGKSELARGLARALSAPILPLDGYYLDLSHLSTDERARRNFDMPDVLDHELFVRHLTELHQGHEIARPVYDYATHCRTGQVETVRPTPFLIIEGLFLFYWEAVRDLLALRIFVDLDDQSCLERRLVRDVQQRGRTAESVRTQYSETVRPMAEKYIGPTRTFADLVLRGDAPLEDSVAAVLVLVRPDQELATDQHG
jgi:uridine kinase